MNSLIYPVYVRHKRHLPKPREFRYSLYTYVFDLDELEQIDRTNFLFGYNRIRSASIFDRDYLQEEPGTIKEKLLRLAGKQGLDIDPSSVSIQMVTSARFLNYIFNPASFYYLFGHRGELLATVAEVNNTYNEKHAYILTRQQNPGYFPAVFSAFKQFHVSPFNDMAGTYRFRFSDIRQELDIGIELHKDGNLAFEAEIKGIGKPSELSPRNLSAFFLKHPLAPHLTYPRILKQAAMLYFGSKLPYNDKPEPVSPMTIRTSVPRNVDARSSRLNRICRSLMLRYLSRLQYGELHLILPDQQEIHFQGEASGPSAKIQVNDLSFFRKLMTSGDIGLGETYSEGIWTTPDLKAVFTFFLENKRRLWDFENRTAGRLIAGAWRVFRKGHQANTIRGSRKNIHAHYDLSNDLFSIFLDKTMTYSCAIFNDPADRSESLEEAQIRKLDTVCRKARLHPGEHVLEIGCGWGAFAVHAARHYDCRVTGITISENQFAYASERIRREGLEGRVEILFKDYRQLSGHYDKIVSIEMLEAVGHRFHPVFFKTIDRLLTPDGLAVIQAIGLASQRYDVYRRDLDWISKHIFPSGLLVSMNRISNVLTRHTSLDIQSAENIGMHYGRTLGEWLSRFQSNISRIKVIGFDDYFIRAWEYYLSICQVGFIGGHLNDMQLVLSRDSAAAAARLFDIKMPVYDLADITCPLPHLGKTEREEDSSQLASGKSNNKYDIQWSAFKNESIS